MKQNQIEIKNFIKSIFEPIGYKLTNEIEVDPVPKNSKYCALKFSLNNKKIIYRNAKVTPDRPGAFVTIWQRPSSSSLNNKPISLNSIDLDYLFIRVKENSDDNSKEGIFIFPTSILIKKKLVLCEGSNGKTGFRVFPPWSADRGGIGMKVFSASGKKTQSWQLPFFVEIDNGSVVDSNILSRIFTNK